MTKITIDRAVLEQALDALHASQAYVEASSNAKLLDGWGNQLDNAEKALTAGRAVLTVGAGAGEAVAWAYRLRNKSGWGSWTATMLGGRKPQQANWLEIEVRPLVYGDTHSQASEPAPSTAGERGALKAIGGLVDCGECRAQGCPAGRCANATKGARTVGEAAGSTHEFLESLKTVLSWADAFDDLVGEENEEKRRSVDIVAGSFGLKRDDVYGEFVPIGDSLAALLQPAEQPVGELTDELIIKANIPHGYEGEEICTAPDCELIDFARAILAAAKAQSERKPLTQEQAEARIKGQA